MDLHKKWLAGLRDLLKGPSKLTKEERTGVEQLLASLSLREAPTDRELDAAGRGRAQQKVSLVRAMVLDDFGDKKRVTRLVAALVLEED